MAPAAVLYLWTMSALRGLGWAIVLFFAVCCALRLARFNTQVGAELPAYAAPFFTGVPAPAGAGLVMVPMFLSFEWGDWLFRSPYLNAVTVTGIALLMVSKVPTVSLKRIRIPHHFVVPTLLGIGVAGGLCHDRAVADPDRHRHRLCRLDPADDPRLLSAAARAAAARRRDPPPRPATARRHRAAGCRLPAQRQRPAGQPVAALTRHTAPIALRRVRAS